MQANTQYGTRYKLDLNGSFERKTRDMIVEPTEETPFVKYCRDENMFMVKGNSVRSQVHEFYDPLISKAKSHLNEGRELDVIFFFNMINPTTAKVLFDLFKFIRLKKMSGVQVNVTWCTEDSNNEMYETGEDLAEIYDLNFNFLTI